MNYIESLRKFIIHNKVISLILLYNILTLVMFYAAPLHFPNKADMRIPILVSIYLSTIMFGYIYSKSIRDRTSKISLVTMDERKYNAILVIISCISIIDVYLNISRQADTYNVFSVLSYIFEVMKSPGIGYFRNQEVIQYMAEHGGSFWTKFSTFVAPFKYISLVMGMHRFGQYSKKLKILVLVNITLYVLSYLVIGTNIGIFIFILILLSVVLTKDRVCSFINENFRTFISIVLLSVVVFLLVIFMNINSRSNRTAIPDEFIGIEVNQDSLMLDILPDRIGLTYIYLTTYVSHGYSGLGYSLDKEWLPTYGFGSGRSLMRYGEKITGINIEERTYQYRVHDDWNSTIKWHTAYSWIANDVSFAGVPFILFIYGFMYYVLIERARRECIVSLALLPLYTLFFLFLSANNFIFSNTYYMFPFIFLHLVLISHVVWNKDYKLLFH